MTASPDKRAPSPVQAADIDHAAGRLLAAISSACDPRAGFADQVEAALRATLALLSAELPLARLLTVEAYLGRRDDPLLSAALEKRFGVILRHAAATDPELIVNPPFLEPILIGGISFQISRRVLAGQPDQLPQLLPGLLGFTLAYYLA